MGRLEERYLRWVMRVAGVTPRYLIKEKLQREKIRSRAGRRAWEYEKRLEKGRREELARLCWEELKEKGRRGKTESG